ncbi:Pentatricopeptide repeat-containing protein [Smittium culicis]|uniref:Pentatricopeptide repeat-containing protein n=1 Tax=Smittium culicis TaxID=133412 RepID=A0A1R1X1B2_9FUNG|nr:Pentatricopeptide repeat-containing protein [Smittium culicis]
MIRYCSDNGMFIDAIRCYSDLIREDAVYPRASILKLMYKACSEFDKTSLGDTDGALISQKISPLMMLNISMANSIKKSNLDEAIFVFKEAQNNKEISPDILSFYILFYGYHEAAKVTIRSIRMGSPLKFSTQIGLKTILEKPKIINQGNSEIIQTVSNNLEDNPEHPRQIFRNSIKKTGIKLTPPIYNLIISTLVGFGDFKGAQEVYHYMTSTCGINPTVDTYSSLIRMFLRRLDVKSAEQLLTQFFEKSFNNEIEINLLMYNSLIFSAAKAGLVDLALDIYTQMVGRKCMIFETKKFRQEFDLDNPNEIDDTNFYKELFMVKVYPDSDSYYQLIVSLLRQRRPQEALTLYEDMYALHVVPSPDLTAMIVDGLQYNDLHDEARRVLRERYSKLRKLEKYWNIE